VLDVGWKSDGKLLASAGADNVIKVWTYETGEQARTIPAHGKQVTRLVFIGTTPQFATCSGDATVKFWNVDNGGNVRNFGGNNDYVYAVGVSPDGAVVAAGGEEGVVRLYNGGNGQLVKSLLPPAWSRPWHRRSNETEAGSEPYRGSHTRANPGFFSYSAKRSGKCYNTLDASAGASFIFPRPELSRRPHLRSTAGENDCPETTLAQLLL